MCAQAGLCELLCRPANGHHGPGLSAGLSHLARQQRGSMLPRPWVWLLDSDCVVARRDAAEKLLDAVDGSGAAIAGEPFWNPWHGQVQFAGFSLLLDPARAWRRDIGAFVDLDDPVGEFERSCRALRLATCAFPFTQDGYLIHLGRGTLAGVRDRGEESHPLFSWAQDHHEPHFQQVAGAAGRYAQILLEFHEAVVELTAGNLIQACRER